MHPKILSTVGPATDQKINIRKLLKFGDILRTNGSHNTIKWHEKISILIKSVNPEAVHLFDIPGVKPRTKNSTDIAIKLNEEICFYYNKNFSHKSKIKRIELTKPLPSLTNKEKFFSLSDGQFIFEVINFKKNYLVGKSKSNFELSPHKGLNIPGAIYDNKLQLDHYKKFLKKSKNVKFDVIGLSYIQSKNVINHIRKKYNDKIKLNKSLKMLWSSFWLSLFHWQTQVPYSLIGSQKAPLRLLEEKTTPLITFLILDLLRKK